MCLVSHSSSCSVTANGYMYRVASTKEPETRLTQCILPWAFLFRLFSWKCCQFFYEVLLQFARIKTGVWPPGAGYSSVSHCGVWLCIASGIIPVCVCVDTKIHFRDKTVPRSTVNLTKSFPGRLFLKCKMEFVMWTLLFS